MFTECLFRHRGATVYSRDNMEEFLNYRFVEPGRAILNDLILNKRQRLTDAGAIEDAKASLQRVSTLVPHSFQTGRECMGNSLV